MILHENRLPADDSHGISYHIGYFWRSARIWNCRLLQIIGGALRVNFLLLFLTFESKCSSIKEFVFLIIMTLSEFCSFDLILYVPVNNFSVMLRRIFMCWTSPKHGLMCLAQWHNAVLLVRLKPATPRSWVKHSTNEPMGLPICSLMKYSKSVRRT